MSAGSLQNLTAVLLLFLSSKSGCCIYPAMTDSIRCVLKSDQ